MNDARPVTPLAHRGQAADATPVTRGEGRDAARSSGTHVVRDRVGNLITDTPVSFARAIQIRDDFQAIDWYACGRPFRVELKSQN